MFIFWGFIYLLVGVIVSYKTNPYSKASFVLLVFLWLPMFVVGLAILALMIWEERKGGI